MPVTGRIEAAFEIAGGGTVLILADWEGAFEMPATLRVGGRVLSVTGFDLPRVASAPGETPLLAVIVAGVGAAEARGWIGEAVVVEDAEATP